MLKTPIICLSCYLDPSSEPNLFTTCFILKKTSRKNIRCSDFCPFLPLVRSAKSLGGLHLIVEMTSHGVNGNLHPWSSPCWLGLYQETYNVFVLVEAI